MRPLCTNFATSGFHLRVNLPGVSHDFLKFHSRRIILIQHIFIS